MSARRGIKVDGVFDIETENWDRFVVGGLLYHGKTQIFYHDEEGAYVDAILECKGDLWAWNGGRFDAIWLVEHLIRRGIKATIALAGSSIVSLRLPGLTIRDAARLIPMSLAKWSEGSAAEKDSFDYSQISTSMPAPLRARLVDYLVKDLHATQAGLERLESYAAEHDLDLRGTIGAAAWSTAMRRLGLDAAEWGDARDLGAGALYSRARAGYYGGRTSVIRQRAAAGWHYDLNSAYPAALRDLAIPTGTRELLDAGPSGIAYGRGREGIVRASVVVPATHCPPLPIRLPGPRISFPVGTFTGTWAANELRYAEECGARVLAVGQGLWWSDSRRVFRDFCETIFGLRAKAGAKTPLGTWLKLFANSLTGKFAQHPERDVLATQVDEDDLFCKNPRACIGDVCTRSDKCCMHRCTAECGRWRPYGVGLRFFQRQVVSFSPSAHVHWAAYLTAHTRCELHRQLVGDDDGASAVYCDTDSVFSTRPRHRNIGNDLGQWKLEDEFVNFRALAPKTYAYETPDGAFIAKAKGLPHAEENWNAIAAGELVELDRGVEGLRTAARRAGSLFARRQLARRITPDEYWVGDRIKGADGATRAPTIEEARERGSES